jgi:tetratricopeptide (TPR) repeat protein
MMPWVLLLLALAAPAWWRETNSHAASVRGAKEYAKKQYAAAAAAYDRAASIAPSPRGAFNLGTAQIAQGEREKGSASIAGALADPALRADAFFNRGNSALGAQAFEHAIRDYSDALRANPRHAGAKRNLEIALSRRQQQEEARKGGQSGAQQQRPQQPRPAPGSQRPKEGDLDLEALLRSVQQQEQEELRRMKGRGGQEKVGW